MNIKTDFGIGDEVWFIDGDNGYPHLYKGKVTNITITSENGRPVVKYTLDGDDEPFYVEGELYATAEECVELYIADVQRILDEDLKKAGKPTIFTEE